MAYEPPVKEVEERRMESLRRVREAKAAEREYVNTPILCMWPLLESDGFYRQYAGQQLTEMIDYEQNSELVGQLK